MIAYVDISTLLRAFLPNEAGHASARALIEDRPEELVLVTGWLTRIEAVASVTKRTLHLDQGDRDALVDAIEAELGTDGSLIEIVPVADEYDEIRRLAVRIARGRWVRAPDAIHVANALVIRALLPELFADDSGDPLLYFVTSDDVQREAASAEGLPILDPTEVGRGGHRGSIADA